MATLTSQDGTTIGYEVSGHGPAVVLIDGALGFRGFGSMPKLAALLAPSFTVVTFDRRGRGESGDTPPYALSREIEDIEALVDAIGGSAALFGHSSGACLALEATLALPDMIVKLAMYEPPYDSAPGAASAWHAYSTQLDEAIGEGRNADAVDLFMRLVGTPQEMVAGMRHEPWWPTMESVAPTLQHDRAAMGRDRTVPVEAAARIEVPVLVMNGSLGQPFMASTAEALASAAPLGQHVVLEGQRHAYDAGVLAPVLAEFLRS